MQNKKKLTLSKTVFNLLTIQELKCIKGGTGQDDDYGDIIDKEPK